MQTTVSDESIITADYRFILLAILFTLLTRSSSIQQKCNHVTFLSFCTEEFEDEKKRREKHQYFFKSTKYRQRHDASIALLWTK
jgi:hypothetical protein